MAEAEEKVKKSGKLGRIVLITIIVILVGIAAASSYFYYQAQKKITELSSIKGQQMLAQKEVESLLTQVGKHMVLPEKEKPTVATVTDVKALKKNQPFFENAQNGDKVIVYVQARKAIIYNPERDVIVNVGAVAVDETGEGNAEVETPVVVEVRNGTATSGLARTVGDAIASNKNYTVTTVTDSAKKDYEKTIMVNYGSGDANAIAALANSLQAQVVKQLPEGEKASQADVLLIVGADQQQ